MGYFRNLFATADKIAVLTSQLAFVEERARLAEWKCEQLEKEVKAERRRFDKVQAVFLDFVAKKEGAQGRFAAIQAPPPEPVVPEPLTLYEESKLEGLAESFRLADIEEGREPRSLDEYREKLRENPSRYLTEIN